MKVRDLMTEQVPYCRASDMASHAARVMMDLGVGGVVPIVDQEQESTLLGVVTLAETLDAYGVGRGTL